MKPLIKSKERKRRKTKSKYLKKKFTWRAPDFPKSRGVVGVPTNGDMLGEPILSED